MRPSAPKMPLILLRHSENLYFYFSPFRFLTTAFFYLRAVSCVTDSCSHGCDIADPRDYCFLLPGGGRARHVSLRSRASGPPVDSLRACPLPLAVCGDMAATSLPAWLILKPRAGTFRAFSTAMSPATRSPRPALRECLPRGLRALAAVGGRNTGLWWLPRWLSTSRPRGSRCVLCQPESPW